MVVLDESPMAKWYEQVETKGLFPKVSRLPKLLCHTTELCKYFETQWHLTLVFRDSSELPRYLQRKGSQDPVNEVRGGIAQHLSGP